MVRFVARAIWALVKMSVGQEMRLPERIKQQPFAMGKNLLSPARHFLAQRSLRGLPSI
jgi:hypothetical protein